MMKKNKLRMIVLGAALVGVSFTGSSRAADDPNPPANPPATTPPPANPRRNFDPAERLKTFRDRFEGINLTDDQMKKIDGFLDTATAAVKTAGDDMDAKRQAMRKLEEDTNSILTDVQKTALRAKMRNMMFDEMKKRFTSTELKLTDDQTTKINAIIDDAKKQAADLKPGTDAREDRMKVFQLMRDTSTKVSAILTPDQQKLVPQPRWGGRGPGGRGQGGAPANPPAQ